MLHRANGVSICGPCTCPRSNSFCTWSNRHWASGLHRSLRLQGECSGSKIRHSTSLSSQCSFQRFAPRLVATRYADYSMYSTFLTASPGSVLFSRSNLLKRKDLCFSCLRLGLIRHRRSLRSSHLFSKYSPRFFWRYFEKLIF